MVKNNQGTAIQGSAPTYDFGPKIHYGWDGMPVDGLEIAEIFVILIV